MKQDNGTVTLSQTVGVLTKLTSEEMVLIEKQKSHLKYWHRASQAEKSTYLMSLTVSEVEILVAALDRLSV